MAAGTRPLCVDLDGSLVRTDTLLESLLLLFAKQHPLQALWRLPFWLFGGKAGFKARLAACATPDPATLPFNLPLLEWLHAQRADGRRLILVTAADQRVADRVARHTDLFEDVLASDGHVNLSGETKRRRLVERFGERGYDYVGNSAQDLPVWRSAHDAVVVGSEGLKARAAKAAAVIQHYPTPATLVRAKLWLHGMRLHQWAKNMLVFVPLLLGQKLGAPEALDNAMLAFLAFGLCASSVYLLNDLFDLAADRAHPRKRNRPFASGQLPLASGMLAVPVLLLGAVTLALQLPAAFVAILGLYYLTTLAYSLRLKRVPMLDVMVLAGLYTARVIAGAFASGVALSFWLLAFSAFLFLSLAIVKRCTELLQLPQGVPAGRGYRTDDLPLLRSVGIAAGFAAVLVLALYINSPQSQLLYAHTKVLWALCPLLLLWLSRVWLLSHRSAMHDDPVVFALRDRVSLCIGGLFVGTILLAG